MTRSDVGSFEMARGRVCDTPGDIEAQAKDALTYLRRKFPEGAPADDLVRRQGFTWTADQWRKRWPSTLSLPAQLADSEPRRPYVSRQEVFERARNVTTETDAVELFLLMAAWGTGTKARPIARVARVLHQNQAAPRLLSSHRAVREGDPVEAYRRLYAWSDDRIKYFGPAFFTKWLYFSAYDTWTVASGPAPLILDARVAASLGWKGASWPAARYGTYLDVATAIRDEWAPGEALHVVEYALFQMAGRHEPRHDA